MTDRISISELRKRASAAELAWREYDQGEVTEARLVAVQAFTAIDPEDVLALVEAVEAAQSLVRCRLNAPPAELRALRESLARFDFEEQQ